MQRIRVLFEKKDEARFISHLDFARAVERAVRRASIPIAYSEGFHPHPKISFASALAVGVTSAAEYADFELNEYLSPQDFISRLSSVMPPGLKAKAAVSIDVNDKKSLMSMIEAASYQIELGKLDSDSIQQLDNTIEGIVGSDSLVIERETKNGLKKIDIRPMIISLRREQQDGNNFLNMVVKTGSEGNLRPDELIDVLVLRNGLPDIEMRHRIHRTGLYCRAGGAFISPIDACRA